MTDKQPEALRLADALDAAPYSCGCTMEAAAELRRLHAENAELLEALKMAWPLIETEKLKQDGSYGSNFVQAKADRIRAVYEKSRAAIAKVEGKQ